MGSKEDKWWSEISGPDPTENICPGCGLYLLFEGEEKCKFCRIIDKEEMGDGKANL